MAMSRRARVLVGLFGAGLFIAAALYVVLFSGGEPGVGPVARGNPPGETPVEPPSICPLTGERPEHGSVPDRPALAVKVENLPEARPQTGLSWADVIYEEPVEAGITRFIAVYQCSDAGRIQPVRSARLTDPDVLVQYGRPLIGYAGAVPPVVERIRALGLVDVPDTRFPEAYERNPERAKPHDLVTSTTALYEAGGSDDGPPAPVFLYTEKEARGRPVAEIHIPFSTYSDVSWRWDGASRAFLRYDGNAPHGLSDGTQISTTNVIVQVVRIRLTSITDVNGVRSPEAITVGSGKAYILRNGRVIEGTWSRPALSQLTRFRDRSGAEIGLAPGQTWVELVPTDVPISIS